MSISAVAQASFLVRAFECEDAARFGGQQPARRALARKLGVAPGTLGILRKEAPTNKWNAPLPPA